jgi:hypothetical protein
MPSERYVLYMIKDYPAGIIVGTEHPSQPTEPLAVIQPWIFLPSLVLTPITALRNCYGRYQSSLTQAGLYTPSNT